MRRTLILFALAAALAISAFAQRGGMRTSFRAGSSPGFRAGAVPLVSTTTATGFVPRWSYVRFPHRFGFDGFGFQTFPNAAFGTGGLNGFFTSGLLKNPNCFQNPRLCQAFFRVGFGDFAGFGNGFWGGYSPYGYGYGYGWPGMAVAPEQYGGQDITSRLQAQSGDLDDLLRHERLMEMIREQDAADAAAALRRTPTMPYAVAPPIPFVRPQTQAAPAPSTRPRRGTPEASPQRRLHPGLQPFPQSGRQIAPQPNAQPEPEAGTQAAPEAVLAPPTVLVFRNQQQLEVRNYAVAGNTLYDLDSDMQRRIPVSELDLAATAQKNSARGVVFRVPGQGRE